MFNAFFDRLTLLKSSMVPKWGKMSPQHMVEHLTMAFEMSTGKLKVKCVTPDEKIPLMKRFLMSEKPLPQLFINPIIGEGLLPLRCSSMDESKIKLKEEILEYEKYYSENPDAKNQHVTFGDLNKTEWDKFHQKHLTHHLSQFGLI